MDSTVGPSQSARHSSPCTDFVSIAMNKFLKKRPEAPPIPDTTAPLPPQPASPGLKKSSTSRWKKNKKQPEVKPELDLSLALPSSDEFRTSLIMPSLSTRFSMLREQDDPKSKLGKASDDSVLQPRRKSRMADFGYNPSPLFDIAEVSSLSGSVRPPFAEVGRQHSFASADTYGSDADASPSVMSRSRPGEGNILFGGRQKIYRIPTTGPNSGRSRGRLVYDDDVGVSAFQRYRVRDREVDESQFPRSSDESPGFDFGLEQPESESRDGISLIGLDILPIDSAKDLTHSPSLSSYEKKRSTASSTARSDARSSTAATSIASQSAVTSAQPSPAAIAPAAPSPVSATAPAPERSGPKMRRLYEQGLDQHMQDQHTSAMSRLNSLQRGRGLSTKGQPPHLHSAKSTGNLHERSVQPVYALRTQSPPLPSPLPSLNTSVKSADSNSSSPTFGASQSPVDSHWDENKVLTQALEPGDRGKATALGAFNKPAQAFDEQQYLERQKALQRTNSNAAIRHKNQNQSAAQQHASRLDKERSQSSTDLSAQPRSQPSSRRGEATNAYNTFQNAANQLVMDVPPVPSPAKSPLPDTHRTFFGNISASEDEDEDDDSQHVRPLQESESGHYAPPGRWQPTQLQPVSEHPAYAMRRSKASLREETANLETRGVTHSASSQSLRPGAPTAYLNSETLDSPTLGPRAQPLNGMVHHLRQGSNHSSVYPADEIPLVEDAPPQISNMSWENKQKYSHDEASDRDGERESTYSISNPWDLEERGHDRDRVDRHHSTVSPIDEIPGMNMPARHSEVSVPEAVPTKQRPPFVREDSDLSLRHADIPSWQQELRKQHSRDISSATMQEREAFANDLAARRAAIQESIKSRGNSPAPAPLRSLAGVRTKPSRESLVHAHDVASKPRVSTSSARSRGNSSPRPPLPTAQHPAFKPEGPGPSNGPSRDVDPVQVERILNSSRSTPSNRGRSRSNSGATNGRSRSRTGPYRDDLEKAMIEGHGSSAAAYTPDVSPFPMASPDLMGLGDYDYEGGKNSNYFEAQSAPGSRSATSNGYAPTRQAPLANAFSQNATPPLSDANSSLPSTTYTPIVPSSARGPGLRKKTISKHDISEPTLISSTSNVETVELPEGASLKNGMEEAPPIPPINPRRRTTRKLFSRHRSDSDEDHEPRATASDPNLFLNTSPRREFHFQPSPVVRMPISAATSPAASHYGFNHASSPEHSAISPRAGTMSRAVGTPTDGAMF